MTQDSIKIMSAYYSHIELDSNNTILSRNALIDHIREVAQASRSFIFAFPEPMAHKKEMETLAFIVGLAHDFGKYSTFFQGYLLNDEKHGTAKNHSFVPAIMAAYLIFRRSYTDAKRQLLDALACFGAVPHHYGDLDNFYAVPDYYKPETGSKIMTCKNYFI